MSRLGFQSWMAGIREWRIALLVSILCMAAIAVAIIRPGIFMRHNTATVAQNHFQVPVHPIPPTQQKPAPTSTKPAIITPGTPAQPVKKEPKKTVAKTPVTHVSPPTVKQTPAIHYYIQLAAFRKRASAERMIAKLQRTPLHLRIVEKGGIYTVQDGPWATRKQADSAKETIYKKTRLKGFVIRQ